MWLSYASEEFSTVSKMPIAIGVDDAAMIPYDNVAMKQHFWNTTNATIGITSTSLITAAASAESSLGALNRATQNDAAMELPGQLTLPSVNIAFGYLQSDQFASTTPSGYKQSQD